MPAKSLVAFAAIGMAHAACANDIFGRPEYGPSGMTRAVGYHDHTREDGTWAIETRSSSMQRSGYAGDMALYRAAEVATQQGHRFFQLLRSEGTIGTGMMNRGAETVSLIVRFADTDAPPADCLQRGRHPGTCYTAEASKILSRLEPRIRNATWRLDNVGVQTDTQSISDHSGLVRFSTLVRFDVTERGKIENCTVVESDGPADFNAGACQSFLWLARFNARRSNVGEPIRSTRTARVTWQQSDLGGPISLISSTEIEPGQGTASAAPATAPVSRTLAEATAPAPPAAPRLARGAPAPGRASTPSRAKARAKAPTSSMSRAAAQDDTVVVPLDPA